MMPLLPVGAQAIAEVVRAYLSVRTGHDAGCGLNFEMADRGAAVEAAKSRITPLIYFGKVNGWTRVSIETRWQVRYLDKEAMGEPVAAGVDMAVARSEVLLTAAEKADVLGRPEYQSVLGEAG